MKTYLVFTILFVFIMNGYSQQPAQTVRGIITDADSKSPLGGVSVTIAGTNPQIGAISDAEGNFRLNNVPIGRIILQFSRIGYEPRVIPEIEVNSGRETIQNLSMQEIPIAMKEVVLSAGRRKGKPTNDMALVSGRSISPEETNRYAGGFNDPSRIISNFAGVANNPNNSNEIIVRGNSPKYMQWRLEGIQITNPNHFADQAALGGGISTLNNNLLATSDFYTSAFAPEYGDVLSGVYDLKLRAGNNEKREAIAGIGLTGTELTLEGPFKKGYGGSYLVNYRYSTVTLLSNIGLLNIDGSPLFQDGAFKIVLPTEKKGTLSFFGLGGNSRFHIEDITPQEWETPGNRTIAGNIKEDLKKSSNLLNVGANHTYNINSNSFILSTLAYSQEGINDKVYESKVMKTYNDKGEFVKDSVIDKTINYRSRLLKSTYRGSIAYHNKINSKNKIQVGVNYSLINYKYNQSQILNNVAGRQTLLDFNEFAGNIKGFVAWKHRLRKDITIVSGLHYFYVFLNNKSSLEPRVALNWKFGPTNSIQFGYGKHSTMESIHNYFAKVKQSDGSVVEPNHDLGLLKAHHFVLGYEKRFSKNLAGKAEVYYQYLYNLPVENLETSNYSTINEGLDFKYVDLVNKGTGRNYGIELTLEKYFSKNYYFLVNTSIYQSKYKALDGVERNTVFNGNYLVNILVGKEFRKLGRKDNQTLGLNGKVFLGGGQKYIPLLRNSQGNLVVDPASNQIWDYDKAYQNSFGGLYKIVLSVSYKWNKSRTTHEIYLNLDNITNAKHKLTEFYDRNQPGSVGYTTQFGLFPNMLYRVYF